MVDVSQVGNIPFPSQQIEFDFDAMAKKFRLNQHAISDENDDPNLKLLVYGAPGSGKTVFEMLNLLTYYGPKAELVFLSYDGQTRFTKKQLLNDGVITPEQGKQLKVYDLYLASPEGDAADGILEGGQLIIEQTRRIIKMHHPNAFVFDYADAYAQQAEMLARMRKEIRPFQGVPKKDWEMWRERKSFLVTIDKLANQNLQPGGMRLYAGWETVKEVTDLGQTNNIIKEPNWSGIITAGYTARVRTIRESLLIGGIYTNKFWVRVMDSRSNSFLRDGMNFDVTGYKSILPKYIRASNKENTNTETKIQSEQQTKEEVKQVVPIVEEKKQLESEPENVDRNSPFGV